MISLVTAFLVTARGFPNTRAEFVRALAAVHISWSKSQVLQVLGKPDQTYRDPANLQKQDEGWGYGTYGHPNFPTLGSISFENDKVTWVVGNASTPPPVSVISEPELAAGIRELSTLDSSAYLTEGSAQSMIAAANFLIHKGQPKALAILKEYGRVSGPQDDWPFWVARVAFTSKLPHGVFPLPGIGGMDPSPPKMLSTWPTFPIKIEDGIPVNYLQFVTIEGVPEIICWYMDRCAKDWTLKSAEIVPPPDPFVICQPVREGNGASALAAKLAAIRSLMDDIPDKTMENASQHPSSLNWVLKFYHEKFLTHHYKWDRVRQVYAAAATVEGATGFHPVDRGVSKRALSGTQWHPAPALTSGLTSHAAAAVNR